MLKNKRILHDLNIVDFGLASFVAEESYLFRKCGTPGFVAPEILNIDDSPEKTYDGKCDIFSAGVILHLM